MCNRTLQAVTPGHFEFDLQPKCKRCPSRLIIVDAGERVCKSCGLVQGPTYDNEALGNALYTTNSPSYKRIFYFNERCVRWLVCEPKIAPDIWQLIREEANKKHKYGELKKNLNRKLIGKILRNVVLSPEIQLKHRSTKFKQRLLTQKRFYDKYYEKWKTIKWKLTGIKPLVPCHQLVAQVKALFAASQVPFELYRHKEDCDGRYNCEKYFGCQHNFTNLDYAFRMFLQICDSTYGFQNSFSDFKNEFPLASKKVVSEKLRPMFILICKWNGWPMPIND